MHQLRSLLRCLRYRALEQGLFRSSSVDAGLDTGERHPRRREHGAPASSLGNRRLPFLPFAPVLPGALPANAQPDGIHRGAEAAQHGGLSQGRDMNVRLYLWQRGTAAVMAPLVLIHIAVIFYATRQGLSAADILSRTRGSVLWATYYGLFVAAVCIHAAIGIRNILTEWTPLNDRNAGRLSLGLGF